jgi:molybdate transport system regulatory protein
MRRLPADFQRQVPERQLQCKKWATGMATEFIVHSKVWIEDERGNAVFGSGRHAILEAVDRLRSLQAAAKELKMSYRAVWCRIKISEERLGKSLIVRDGRGSKLTPFARELMTAFQNMQIKVRSESDAAFADQMLDMLK